MKKKPQQQQHIPQQLKHPLQQPQNRRLQPQQHLQSNRATQN